jgi:hypothetical protein
MVKFTVIVGVTRVTYNHATGRVDNVHTLTYCYDRLAYVDDWLPHKVEAAFAGFLWR